MKYLALVERTPDGFRDYAHRLAGCQVFAATAKEAEDGIIAAVKARPNAVKDNGQVEVIVAVQGPAPKRPRDDGMDELYDQFQKEFTPEELEWVLTFDPEKVLADCITGEELLRQLEEEERLLSGGAAR